MKSLYNKVYKNYQVNMGRPFEVKLPAHITVAPDNSTDQNNLEDAFSAANMQAVEQPVHILERAREEAELIIAEAHLETERMMEEARILLEEERNQLLLEATQKGYEDGLQQAQRQSEDLLSESEFIREHAKMEYSEVIAGIEKDALDMIMDIAQKVIGMEIRENKDALIEMVKQAFDKSSSQEDLSVRVSLEDGEYIEAHKQELLRGGISDFEVRKDAGMQAGDLIVETPLGTMDAGVQTKMKKIEETFQDILETLES